MLYCNADRRQAIDRVRADRSIVELFKASYIQLILVNLVVLNTTRTCRLMLRVNLRTVLLIGCTVVFVFTFCFNYNAVSKTKIELLEREIVDLKTALLQQTEDGQILLYNRVPKTGSTSMAGLAYELCTANEFTVIHVNITRNSHILSLADQLRFVKNVSSWNEKKPALYHGHFSFMDFSRFGVGQHPIYINMIREPLDRLVSYYYFLRHGDDFRPSLKRRKSHNKDTFDECVSKNGHDCNPESLWMQVPFFCGHSNECWSPGNEWALEAAKRNLVMHYFVVGITEQMGELVAVLEATLPRFFRGATTLYQSGQKTHLRKTNNKTAPSVATLSKLKDTEIYRMELDFYLFAKNHFDQIRSKIFELQGDYLVPKQQHFSFEKIRPR